MAVYMNDFVYIRNADLPDPDTPDGCDIAKVLRCYDNGRIRQIYRIFQYMCWGHIVLMIVQVLCIFYLFLQYTNGY